MNKVSRGTAEKIVIAAAVFTVAVVTVTKTLAISGNQGQDFAAYHQAGERFLRGENPYVATDAKAYKYAPTLLPFFAFFALFPLSFSLLMFATVNLVLLAGMPIFAVSLLERDARLRVSSNERAWAYGLGLIGSLRFIDGEVYNAQVNGWSLAFILLAAAHWLGPPLRQTRGAIFYALGAFFKFHPLFGLGIFFTPRGWRTCLRLAGVIFGVALIPDPRLWGSLVAQLRATTPLLVSPGKSYVYQGFYGYFTNFWGLNQNSLVPFGCFAAVALVFLWRVPKFNFGVESERPGRHSASFLTALFSLLMLGVTASPLPWQHTYVVWGSFVPIAFLAGSRTQRIMVAVLASFMGLSARGIVGFDLSSFLEIHQSLFALSLILSVLLLSESRRWRAIY